MSGKPYTIFTDWSEAFDFCREGDAPCRVIIREDDELELWVLFPSGHAEFIREMTDPAVIIHKDKREYEDKNYGS